jgi:hypothetical protein
MPKKVIASLLLTAGLALFAPAMSFAFPCYCNGRYIGEYDDILACYNACSGFTLATPNKSSLRVSFLQDQLFSVQACAGDPWLAPAGLARTPAAN